MNILNQLLRNIGDSIKNVYVKNELHDVPDNIILLDGNTQIRPSSICIGSQRDIFYTIKKQTMPRNTVFFTPATTNQKTYSNLNVNLVETALPLAPLYNKLNAAMLSLNKAADLSYRNESAFDSFFRDIAAMDLVGHDEIQSRLQELPFYSDDPYNIIVITTRNIAKLKNIFKEMYEEILNVFPSSNITLYSNRMIVMYHSPGRSVRVPADKLRSFESILEKYDAYAGISNHTYNIEMIRTEYIITKNILTISRHMSENENARIFTQEEYGMFYTLDLCYKQFEHIFHHNNILYLTHPGLSALVRYDEEHNTNLREILLRYLLNDRSLSKTSKIMFMHRNTMLNKVNKITDIIEDDLEDPVIRQRLLFSCMLYDYCEKCKQSTLKVLPVSDT